MHASENDAFYAFMRGQRQNLMQQQPQFKFSESIFPFYWANSILKFKIFQHIKWKQKIKQNYVKSLEKRAVMHELEVWRQSQKHNQVEKKLRKHAIYIYFFSLI